MAYSICELKEKTAEIKHKCLEICVNAGIGHVTTAFSCAEIMVCLYYNVMNFSLGSMDNDKFIMSKNHGSVITYPILADLGFIEKDKLFTFMQNGSYLGGHSKIAVPGVDYSGGSLGIGLGVAAGLAYGLRLQNKTNKVYALVGDGESYEGSIWEAAMFAAHNKLTNLTVIVDRNKMACTDFTEHMLELEPYEDKWKSFGWKTVVIDGHDISQILDAFEKTGRPDGDKPVCIIANTVKGHGIDFMSNDPLMHGVAPKGEKAELAFKELERSCDCE